MTTNLTNLVPVSIQYYSFIGIYIMLLTGSFLYTALLIHAIVSYLKHLFFFFYQCCKAWRRRGETLLD